MNVGIIGATGYGGIELIRFLSSHPKVTALFLSSHSFEGQQIEAVYPHLYGQMNSEVSSVLLKAEDVIEKSDVIFSALPHGAGEPFAKLCMESSKHFIDLSADFRFDDDNDTFAAWYGKGFVYPELRSSSVYGLPEMNREKIKAQAEKGAMIIANPGCYPTGASLGIFPALKNGLLKDDTTIIVDSASGVTGAGREPSRTTHFAECADNMSPYKVGSHRHTPEIARNAEFMAGKKVPLIFTPHLAPMNRGILSTIYVPLCNEWKLSDIVTFPSKEVDGNAKKIHALYEGFYRDEYFVRVLPFGNIAATRNVRGSNFCDISIHLDHTGTMLIVITAIDNMVKGAAGQAIQNMNIIMGFEESLGLEILPSVF
ncbi:MAG: N-acetyl-gamma-glutamyl-phosphate reductase [Treponema sp.]|jgi:N-acetyl-gamma-glutamyl-phosphate reductase|nr:N-acetyl-gamma-glutamyl-phosphate reductase [Treponema sp.]